MLQKLRRSNLVNIYLGAKGTFLTCFTLMFFYFLFSVLTNTFLIPSDKFVGNIPSVLRGEYWYIITGPLFHYEWHHLMWNLLPIAVLGPFIEWKIGSWVFVTSFFVSGWVGSSIFCFVFGEFIQSILGIGLYVYMFYGASIAVYALFPLTIAAFLIKEPEYSFITKAVVIGAFSYLILGLFPKADASDAQRFVEIAHLSGFIAGIIGAIVVSVIKRRRKVVSFFLRRSTD